MDNKEEDAEVPVHHVESEVLSSKEIINTDDLAPGADFFNPSGPPNVIETLGEGVEDVHVEISEEILEEIIEETEEEETFDVTSAEKLKGLIELVDKFEEGQELVAEDEEEGEGEGEGEGEEEEEGYEPQIEKIKSRRTIVSIVDPQERSRRRKSSVYPNFGKLSQESSRRSQNVTFDYGFLPRLGVEDMIVRISGDFTDVTFNFEDTSMWTKIMEYQEIEESEEEEEEEIEEKDISYDKSAHISRSWYYQKHVNLTQRMTIETIKNTLLQRKLSLYYRRKHMEYAIQETERSFNYQQKYEKRLDEYGEILKTQTTRRRVINAQIDFLKKAKERKCQKVKELFQNLQNRIKEVGTGLIYSKTASELPEKSILHLMNRQKMAENELSDMRLKYINLKVMVANKEIEIQSLDEVDETHNLNNYEKLKSENSRFSDKIEEKEVELAKLRTRCKDTIQVLAHLREKISAFDDDITDLMDTLNGHTITAITVRTCLNQAKKERDMYRSMYIKLKEGSGLLLEPELLKDMDQSMKEVRDLKKELQFLQEDCTSKIKKIRCIRRRIEENVETAKQPTQTRKLSNKKRLSMVRSIPIKEKPSAFVPVMPEGVLDYLIQDFQPTVRRINVNKHN